VPRHRAKHYLPHAFGYRGRRLVYTYGIVVLALLCGGVLILFGGITDRLIPLYAVGAFLAFTLRNPAWSCTGGKTAVLIG